MGGRVPNDAWFADAASDSEDETPELWQLRRWIGCEKKELEAANTEQQERLNTPMEIAQVQPWCRKRYRARNRTLLHDNFCMELYPDDPREFIDMPAGTVVLVFESGNYARFAEVPKTPVRGTIHGRMEQCMRILYPASTEQQLTEGVCYDIVESELPSTLRLDKMEIFKNLLKGEVANEGEADAGGEADGGADVENEEEMANTEFRKRQRMWCRFFLGQSAPYLGLMNEDDYNKDFGSHEKRVFEHAGLNEKQEAAIRKAIRADPVGLIEGPPGTGKTKVLAALIEILQRAGKRLLVCAPTNEAVNNVMDACSRIDNAVRAGDITRCHGRSEESHVKAVVRRSTSVGPELVQLDEKLMSTIVSHVDTHQAGGAKLAQDLKGRVRQLYMQGLSEVNDTTPVVFATCTAAALVEEWATPADYCIVDEAGKAVAIDVLMSCQTSAKLIMAGDKYQLRPTVLSQEAINMEYDKSALENLMEKCNGYIYRLEIQYRSNECIMKWSSKTFYNGRLTADPSVQSITVNDKIPATLFITTETHLEFDEDQTYNQSALVGFSTSKWNYIEAQLALEYYKQCLLPVVKGQVEGKCDSVLIISPYKAQVDIIRTLASRAELLTSKLRIGTVDSFQGQEADAVILSMVRCNYRSQSGFTKDPNRMNVAVTRAKRHCVMIGDRKTLAAGNKLFSKLTRIITGNTKADQPSAKYGGVKDVLHFVSSEWIQLQCGKAKSLADQINRAKECRNRNVTAKPTATVREKKTISRVVQRDYGNADDFIQSTNVAGAGTGDDEWLVENYVPQRRAYPTMVKTFQESEVRRPADATRPDDPWEIDTRPSNHRQKAAEPRRDAGQPRTSGYQTDSWQEESQPRPQAFGGRAMREELPPSPPRLSDLRFKGQPETERSSSNYGRPPAADARRPPAADVRRPPAIDARRPSEVDARRPPAVDARRPPSAAYDTADYDRRANDGSRNPYSMEFDGSSAASYPRPPPGDSRRPFAGSSGASFNGMSVGERDESFYGKSADRPPSGVYDAGSAGPSLAARPRSFKSANEPPPSAGGSSFGFGGRPAEGFNRASGGSSEGVRDYDRWSTSRSTLTKPDRSVYDESNSWQGNTELYRSEGAERLRYGELRDKESDSFRSAHSIRPADVYPDSTEAYMPSWGPQYGRAGRPYPDSSEPSASAQSESYFAGRAYPLKASKYGDFTAGSRTERMRPGSRPDESADRPATSAVSSVNTDECIPPTRPRRSAKQRFANL